jgi:hypothetical protein
MSITATEKPPLQGFAVSDKPSDGLEPSTPSLPSKFSGDGAQPRATVSATFPRFRR